MIASGCFQASPYVLAQIFEGHYPHVWAACWYPWAFDAAIRLRRGHRGAALGLAPILAATFLAGHPQEGYYLLIALGCWAAFEGLAVTGLVGSAVRTFRLIPKARIGDMVRTADPTKLGTSTILLGSGALLLACGLIGIELIPDAMVQEWGVHWGRLSLRLASRYHPYPINALQLLSPRALGGPADYFGHENYWESLVSFGLIPLFLAIIALAWSPDRRSVRGWLILVAASVLFASGRKLGLFAVVFQVVPGMDRFRVPARSLFLASLGAAMLAGLGVEALRIRASRAEGWHRLARRSAIAVTLLALVILAGRWLAERRKVASEVSSRPAITLRDREGEVHRPERVPEVDRMLLGPRPGLRRSRILAEPGRPGLRARDPLATAPARGWRSPRASACSAWSSWLMTAMR